jgi:large subunit ribosomal protein L13
MPKVVRTTHEIDASGKVVGRLATHIATLLMGKHKPEYSRHLMVGDFVVVINAAKVTVSGSPSAMKNYYRHSGYLGNLKTLPMERELARHPDRVIERAVKGMLPGTRLGRSLFTRLKVYVGPSHPHEAQVNAGKGKPKAQVVVASPPTVPAPAAVAAPAARPRRTTRAKAEAEKPEGATRRRVRRATPSSEETPKE